MGIILIVAAILQGNFVDPSDSQPEVLHKAGFQQLDGNKDGQLALNEMVDAIYGVIQTIFPHVESELGRVQFLANNPNQDESLDEFDTNGDGQLSLSELKALGGKLLKDTFYAADQNGDSVITLEESQAYDKTP